MAATPSGPTCRSTHGISTFVRMQLTSVTIRRYRLEGGRRGPLRGFRPDGLARSSFTAPTGSPWLVHELRGDVHGVGECIAHRRFAVDRLLALAHLVLGGWALDRHRVADVADAIAHRLVVAE